MDRPSLSATFDALLARLRAEVGIPADLDAELTRFAAELEALPWAARMAHDLRAPIGALLHQAQLLAEESLPPEVRAQSLAAMEDNAAALSALLERLTDR